MQMTDGDIGQYMKDLMATKTRDELEAVRKMFNEKFATGDDALPNALVLLVYLGNHQDEMEATVQHGKELGD